MILRFKHADGLYLTPFLGWLLARYYAALRQPRNRSFRSPCIATTIWRGAIINLPNWHAGWQTSDANR